MLGVLVTALLIVAASMAAGWVLLALLGQPRPTPLAGAVGFAALTVACPLLIRLPGRATTAAILVLILLLAGAVALRRRREPSGELSVALATGVVVLALGCLPFGFNEQVGVLGEGVYTNDQAAQLYWTDWLQHGFGPEPSAVRFGYPTGPQAVTATAAQVTGVELDDAFNGLLVAIPVLAALAALSALEALPAVRRVIVASLVGMPYLGASFLAQSAFKETVMALLVLAFAVALESGALAGMRARIGSLLVLAAAAFFTYSVPGLVWFALTLALWLALELVRGRISLPLAEWRAAARTHRRAVIGVSVLIGVVVVLGTIQGSAFVGKIGDVQASTGRLSSPVWPGEALGIWPEGDFRVVRGEVGGAYLATLLGLIVVAAGAWFSWRRQRYGLLAGLVAAAAVYVGARLFASIYVEAKALAVLAPLVVLVALAGLLSPDERGAARPVTTRLRYALGGLAALAFAISTFLALRAAPVGFPDRGAELESLADGIDGKSVVFLGVDRFAGYWLRGTLAESPGGYVPAEVRARPEKVWQQGNPMDLDTLTPSKLDRFDYAITTNATFQSTAPPNLEDVTRTDSFILWKRTGPTPPLRVLREDGYPGRALDCPGGPHRATGLPSASATVLPTPAVGGPLEWSRVSPFEAPATATQKLDLSPGRWELSLQYASQVPITVEAAGSTAELPASLDGMYLTHQGQGSLWAAGSIDVAAEGPTTITVRAADPSGLQRALGVDRKVWLGRIAATRGTPTEEPLSRACGDYVDHYLPHGHG